MSIFENKILTIQNTAWLNRCQLLGVDRFQDGTYLRPLEGRGFPCDEQPFIIQGVPR